MLAEITAWFAPELEVVTAPKPIPAPDEGLFTGVVAFFLVLTLIYVILRALEKRGIIREGPGRKLGRGMGQGLGIGQDLGAHRGTVGPGPPALNGCAAAPRRPSSPGPS